MVHMFTVQPGAPTLWSYDDREKLPNIQVRKHNSGLKVHTSNQTFWSGAVIRRLSVPANVSKPWWVKVFDNINNFHVPEIGAMMTK